MPRWQTWGSSAELPLRQATMLCRRREPRSTSTASLLSLLRGIVMTGASMDTSSCRTMPILDLLPSCSNSGSLWTRRGKSKRLLHAGRWRAVDARGHIM